MQQPLAGFVCEIPSRVLLGERRAANRYPEGWYEDKKSVMRRYHGHVLRLDPLSASGKLLGWFMWLDDHYRGVGSKLEESEGFLEQEAEHAISAWNRKQAWVDAGSPERRKGR